MKKIGILFGQEHIFPTALMDRINDREDEGIVAEFMKIDKVLLCAEPTYDLVIDRISPYVPFYQSLLKQMAMRGSIVINNPFTIAASDKFFTTAIGCKLDCEVPKSVVLPSNIHPEETTSTSFRNLIYPLDWKSIFDFIGFPAYLKPIEGNDWKRIHRIENSDDFFAFYNDSGHRVYMMQEEIVYDEFYRSFYITGAGAKSIVYDPRKAYHERYNPEASEKKSDVLSKVSGLSEIICKELGYDFNMCEFARRGDDLYLLDPYNPVADTDYNTIGDELFDWMVESLAKAAIGKLR